MIPASLLVPLADNDGNPFPAAMFAALEDELVARFGGFTHAGTKGGAWRGDDGVVYRDRSRQYDIAVESWIDIPDFLQLVDRVAVKFRQRAVFVTIAGIPDIVARPST
jgi:hypothetical protein